MDQDFSHRTLPQKLGLKESMRCLIQGAPYTYPDMIASVTIETAKPDEQADFIHLFCTSRAQLSVELPLLKMRLKPAGMLWVSWPKHTSRIGDLNESFIRDLALGIGLVDVKVCSVNEDWSGLKLVYRLKDRE